jgi:hypothetical protein
MRKSFKEWMLEVENTLDDLAGICSLDLCDIDYASFYEDGRSARFAANYALNESGAF